MAFRSYVYEGDTGEHSYYVKLDSDQATLSGGVIGTPTHPFHLKVSKSRKSFGLHPRTIALSREEGTAQDGTGKIHTTRLAICTPAAYAAIAIGAGVLINGIAFKVTGKNPEFPR